MYVNVTDSLIWVFALATTVGSRTSNCQAGSLIWVFALATTGVPVEPLTTLSEEFVSLVLVGSSLPVCDPLLLSCSVVGAVSEAAFCKLVDSLSEIDNDWLVDTDSLVKIDADWLIDTDSLVELNKDLLADTESSSVWLVLSVVLVPSFSLGADKFCDVTKVVSALATYACVVTLAPPTPTRAAVVRADFINRLFSACFFSSSSVRSNSTLCTSTSLSVASFLNTRKTPIQASNFCTQPLFVLYIFTRVVLSVSLYSLLYFLSFILGHLNVYHLHTKD